MRPMTKLFLTAFLALTLSSSATADTQSADPAIEAAALAEVTDMQLDAAFESLVARDGLSALREVAGATTMDCQAAVGTGTETCVVTAVAIDLPVPASLAHH